MDMKPSFIGLACVLAMMLVASCSIKEDRTGCPCYLVLDVDAFVDGGFCHGGAVALKGQGIDLAGPLDIVACRGCGYVKAVPRVSMSVACAAGISGCVLEGSSVLLPAGVQADPLMSFTCSILPDADEYVVVAEPHKQYCRVHMTVEQAEEYAGCDVIVSGRYSGLDLLALVPVRGSMLLTADHEDGAFDVQLLRQADDAGLELAMTGSDGGVLYTIDLSGVLKDASYDWGKTDLDDVTLCVDYARSVVYLEISEWDSDENYRNVEI